MNIKDKLIEAQKEYIKFLEKHIEGLGGYAYAHGIKTSQEEVKKGITHRRIIEDFEVEIAARKNETESETFHRVVDSMPIETLKEAADKVLNEIREGTENV